MTNFISEWKKFGERLQIEEVKRYFDERGFIKAQNFLSHKEVDVIRKELSRYRQDVIPKLPETGLVYYEDVNDPNTIIRLEKMNKHDLFFKKLAESSAFNGLVDHLLGEYCCIDNVQWFSKPPGCKETPPHQDGQYFMHDRAVTLWLALDDVSEENGSIFYVPGSHQKGLLEHYRTSMLGFSQALVEYSEDMKRTEEAQPASAGTLLGHHAFTVHRANPNMSTTKWRPALGLTYWAKGVYEDASLMQRRKDYQDKLRSSLIEQKKI